MSQVQDLKPNKAISVDEKNTRLVFSEATQRLKLQEDSPLDWTLNDNFQAHIFSFLE